VKFLALFSKNITIILSSALGVPSAPRLTSRSIRFRKFTCASFSTTSVETHPYDIFVPNSQNCSLNWLPSHLFQIEGEEKLICKEKGKFPLDQAEASFGDGPCEMESETEFQDASGVEWKE
jgi:hypothetical protein